MSSSFDEFVRGQFPLRPTHPDFERLREVVDMVEKLKTQTGISTKAVYDAFVDAISAAYMGANRVGVNIPPEVRGPGGRQDVRRTVHDMMTNAWVEGLFFGIQFQLLGGHREDPEDTK